MADAKVAIELALERQVAILTLTEIENHISEVQSSVVPTTEQDIRPTAGLVLLVDGKPRSGDVTSTDQAAFVRISKSAVAAWKRDILTDAGILDRTQRRGGWGALTVDVGKQLGGQWTARSLRTVIGLVRRAKNSE